jgi:hypothetical protein
MIAASLSVGGGYGPMLSGRSTRVDAETETLNLRVSDIEAALSDRNLTASAKGKVRAKGKDGFSAEGTWD